MDFLRSFIGCYCRRSVDMNANLARTNLIRAKHLSLNQLSKAKTLYETKLDEKLLISLRGKYPALLEEPDDAD